MVYTMYYDGKQFTVAEEDVSIKEAKEPRAYGNLQVSHFKYREDAEDEARVQNEKLASKEIEMRKCKDCKLWFLLNKEVRNFYIDNKLSVPLRCKRCRNRRKQEAQNKEGN